jgi:hypothetical protein
MFLRWMPILLSLSAASCAPPASDAARPRPLSRVLSDASRRGPLALVPDCGLKFVVRQLIPRPGSGETRVESGAAIPACALPTAADIESACRGPEGVPIPGSLDPNGSDGPQYAFPDYTVQNPVCEYADADRGSANCTFDLVGRPNGRERITARLHHRFRDLSNAIAHNYLSVGWEADSICSSAR